MIAGIVLAAGRSRRMGEPKALLRAGGRTFLEWAVCALRDGGCSPVLVVAAPAHQPGAEDIAAAALALGARLVINPAPGPQQLDSLRVALAALDARCDAALVLPVDVPGVTPAQVRALLDAFAASRAPLVQPWNGRRHGHPVLFARALWPELLADPLPEGARSVIHAHARERVEVPVDRLAADVDTPADYQRLLEDWA